MTEIAKIFRQNYKELCIISHYYLNDFDEAQDVVQEIFFKIIEKREKTKILYLKSYLKTAVRNESLKRIKIRGTSQPIDPNHLVYHESLSDEEESSFLQKKIKLYKEIDSLPEKCKQVFLLCVLEDLKYQEAADKLKISVNTVKTQMKKAFKILRTSLKNVYFLFFA